MKLTTIFITLLWTTFLWAIPVQAAEVNFSWGQSTGQVDGYRIYWGETESGPYLNKLCEVDEATLGYLATLDETQEYYLVCRAFNRYGEGGNSNELHWLYELPGVPGFFDYIMNQIDAVLDKLGVKSMQIGLTIDRSE